MTDAERRAALVEKVAEAISNARLMCRTEKETATAALTMALEEAERVCRRVADVAARKGRDYVVDGLIPEARLQAGRVEGADDCAAAIRALIPSASSSSS